MDEPNYQDMAVENQDQEHQLMNNEHEEVSDHESQFSEDFNQEVEEGDQQPDQQQIKEELKQTQNIPKVSNPISAYGIFNKVWREKNPGQKMSITAMAELWKQMSKQQKQPYEALFKQQKKKYEQYEALMLSIDPNFNKKQKGGLTKDYFFPLHRVKSIMKLDNGFTTSTENVCAMAKAVECFGVFLLEEVKKISEGKKRIDMNSLFDAINNNQTNLWFLNCLIDEYTLGQNSSTKPTISSTLKQGDDEEMQEKGEKGQKGQKEEKGKKVEKQTPKSKKKVQLPKGQLKLTDMF